MDTKLKNYRFSVWIKLTAVLLCIAGMLSLAYGLLSGDYFDEAVRNKDFEASISESNLFSTIGYDVAKLAFIYKNDEEYVRSGKAIDSNDLDSRISGYADNKENEIWNIENEYLQSAQQYQNEITSKPADSTDNKYLQERLDLLKAQKDQHIKEVNDSYDKLIAEEKANYINEQLNDFNSLKESLKKQDGIFYTVLENGNVTLSNKPESSYVETFYQELPFWAQLSADNIYPSSSPYQTLIDYPSDIIPSNSTIYVGMSQQRYSKELTAFTANAQKGLLGIKISAAGLLAFLIGLSYLIYSAGRRPDKEDVHLVSIDMIYLDIALVISVAAIALCFAPIVEVAPRILFSPGSYNIPLIYSVFGVIIATGTLIGLLFVTMFVKRLKRHEVISHTLIYKILSWIIMKVKAIYNFILKKIHSVFDKSPAAMRLVLIFGAYAAIMLISVSLFFAGSAGFLLGFAGVVAVNVVSVYYVLKAFKHFNEINEGAEKIRSGELSYNIPEQGIPELRQLSATINKIADGLKFAVGSQVKAERMKAELITNVSHDLKTPLTSIITYVDLLKTEGLSSENAEKYLGIIDSKSQRLKSLTEDLFEAAKATSGNITVNFERLNVASLISQGLGELSDKIEESGLTFKTGLPAENLYVNADGKLLWRVVENLLSNVFKYALPNSRVYIDIEEHDENVDIIVKNISAYELNIKEDELMERFKRGDASRHSEGSGLGLSIAKSLTELQGGNFSIKIDGDLFKATVSLPKL